MNEVHNTRSLSEVHSSVDPSKGKSPWRRIAAFFGPAYLVSVGYMDPGNWATDLQGGAQFGYKLLWVLVMSNIMALLLQSLSARLGIVQGRDLAQCNREVYPKGINFILYILAELAIAACDLAEVLGMAIGLNLLLGIPLLWGVGITMLDTILLLYLQRLGMRKLEAFIIALVAIIGLCFLVEMIYAKPDMGEMAKGLIPTIPNNTALYIAIGIIGATVMPHNLYLHSALVQTRKVKRDDASIRKAIKFNTIDSAIALNLALFVNAAILILAAAVFYKNGHHGVAALKDAHQLLHQLLGKEWSSHLFAIALIAAGQSSTITGTLAGQIVMEGYLRLRINPIMRRMLTRMLAIVPAVLVIWLAGEAAVDDMLVFSQVLLSMQLAFAVIPLIHFVSDRKKMGIFTIGKTTKIFAWTIAVVISVLNLKLVYEEASKGMAGTNNILLQSLMVLGAVGMLVLLAITIIYPIWRKRSPVNIAIHDKQLLEIAEGSVSSFKKIAIALDYSEKDSLVLQYALRLAKPGAHFVLIHIVESVTASFNGDNAEDYETIKDREQLQKYASLFEQHHFTTSTVLGFHNRTREIARIVKEENADLLIVGSHGHKVFKDWLFGETINTLRHLVRVPVFIAQ
jgi:manganese transport protein